MSAHHPAPLALVTGANKGIGFEVARQLGRRGFHVLVGARSSDAGAAAVGRLAAEGISAGFMQIDLDVPRTITLTADTIARDHGRLDVLVNNAGIADAADGPPSQAAIAAVQRIFAVNVVGALAVAQALLPLLKQSRAARIVNVSSGLGSLALNADPQAEFAAVKLFGYNASKAALNMLTVQLAAELAGTPAKVNSADPGFTATDLNGHRGTQTVAQGASIIVDLAMLPEGGPSGGFFSAAGARPW